MDRHSLLHPFPRHLPLFPRVLALAALMLGLLHPPALQALEMALNCGGNTFISETGITYVADRAYTVENGFGYTNGGAASNWHPIGGADTDSAHYSTLRSNFIEYRFDVPNGDYLLRIRTAEHEKHGPGERIWWIWSEGHTVIDSVDIFAEVGRDFAIDYQFHMTVTDGQLNVYGGSYAAAVILSGIAVVSRQPDSQPPATPGDFQILDSYREINLNWDPPADDDLAGYRIYRATAPGGPYTQIKERLDLVSRYIDRGLDPAETYYYYMKAVDVYGNVGAPTAILSISPLDPFNSELRTYELTVDPADILLMNLNFAENYYVPCILDWDGQQWTDVRIRYKGSFVRSLFKKSYKLNFTDTNLMEDRELVHLNSEVDDPYLTRNYMTIRAHKLAGSEAVDSQFFLCFLNDRFLGLYHDLEQYDEHYLDKRPWLDRGANLYKAEDGATLEYLPNINDYEIYYDKTTNEAEYDWTDLSDLTFAIDTSPDEDLFSELAGLIDLEAMYTYYATQLILQNLNFEDHNYYLYHDLDLNKWTFLPWDTSFTWGNLGGFSLATTYLRPPSYGTQDNRLLERIFDNDFMRRRYLDRALWLMNTDLSSAVRDSLILDAYNQIIEAGQRDWNKWLWENNDVFVNQLTTMTAWSANRENYLRSHIPVYRQDPEIYVNEFMASNNTTISDDFGEFDDWIEIYNSTPEPISLQGYYLTDDLTWGSKWAFPNTILEPYGRLILWADGQPQQGSLHTNFQLSTWGEEIGVFHYDVQMGLQPVDALGFGEQSSDISYARRCDGSVTWEFQAEPTPNGPNCEISDAPEPAAGALTGACLEIGGLHPFLERGIFSLNLPRTTSATLAIHDVTGRRIRTLIDGPVAEGPQKVTWDGRNQQGAQVAPGLYWALLQTPDRRESVKFILLHP
ncbi:MAG: CotH kinase family protein [Candidatus Eisenbacteria bacterium]|uniref:CotH kinase family protein n=1 Tax=Eiseniibacteriota bacterium TaxID=2212470 RepID=A0A948RTR0_UNCEI|nr:CotH kinase family protein [Candidatus Eisenbacteria bacterium]MBU1947462.1 CotH kinase family protein [Candidatus Eisenbacteria bacterium]MBU2690845.1 CotH kinase family protein [Candidatus Eisenbacteria bacterium]